MLALLSRRTTAAAGAVTVPKVPPASLFPRQVWVRTDFAPLVVKLLFCVLERRNEKN